jgi:spore cortex formation protein SpoVR/YcgB (stage V sporulation)
MAADTFYARTNGLFFDVINARTGEVVEELIDCIAEARNYCRVHMERALESEAAEQAALAEQAAEYAQEQKVLDIIYRAVARIAEPAEPGDTAGEIRNRAVDMVLSMINELGRPDLEQKVAA